MNVTSFRFPRKKNYKIRFLPTQTVLDNQDSQGRSLFLSYVTVRDIKQYIRL